MTEDNTGLLTLQELFLLAEAAGIIKEGSHDFTDSWKKNLHAEVIRISQMNFDGKDWERWMEEAVVRAVQRTSAVRLSHNGELLDLLSDCYAYFYRMGIKRLMFKRSLQTNGLSNQEVEIMMHVYDYVGHMKQKD